MFKTHLKCPLHILGVRNLKKGMLTKRFGNIQTTNLTQANKECNKTYGHTCYILNVFSNQIKIYEHLMPEKIKFQISF